MAHQAHNLPWTLLASNFKYRFSPTNRHGVTNLYPRFKSKQGAELEHFVEAFARTIGEHIECELKKLVPSSEDGPEVQLVLSPDDVVLSDAVATKISPTIHRARLGHGTGVLRSRSWMSTRSVEDRYVPGRPCADHRHGDGRCKCPLPPADRKLRAFTHRWVDRECYNTLTENEPLWLGLETLAALVLHGEMETVLRICSQPGVECAARRRMRRHCWECDLWVGWDRIYRQAALAYVCLNVLRCFPELWDGRSGRTGERDYRRTAAYQRTLEACTTRRQVADLVQFPHRQFFGVADAQLGDEDDNIWVDRRVPGIDGRGHGHDRDHHYRDHRRRRHGVRPFDEFAGVQGHHRPTASEVERVLLLLVRGKGLPAELALKVVGFAGYGPRRGCRLTAAPDDPLHADNEAELRKYLTYCWSLMVRCGVLDKVCRGVTTVAQVGGVETAAAVTATAAAAIDWRMVARNAILDLWDDEGGNRKMDDGYSPFGEGGEMRLDERSYKTAFK